MSTRARRQTRRLHLNQAWTNWPENHNDAVALRKAWQRANRSMAEATRRFRLAQRAFAAAARSVAAFRNMGDE